MNISVVVSTYNSPDALDKVLRGYSFQSGDPFELVIADDGSTPETAEVVERARRETKLDITHVWQEDVGFEKCRILNKAIAAARGEYLIFTDGDCVPRHDFVSAHATLAEAGCFLSGGCVYLDAVASDRLTIGDISSGQAFQRRWPASQGAQPDSKSYKLSVKGPWAALADRLTTTQATFNGHNASAWKADIVAVNGFDERMRYGGLDRELGERLVNNGNRARQVRHRAIVLHLHHEKPYKTAEGRTKNDAIRNVTRTSGAVWAEKGLDQWVDS
jgi:glycosyltransferase involved in cell wall biosynthesis